MSTIALGSSPERAATATVAPACCYHCGEALAGSTLTARIRDKDEPVCCQGCLAVAELIAHSGLVDYYRFREASGMRPDIDASDTWTAFARPEVAVEFVSSSGEIDAAVLAVGGQRCAACSWLIDRILQGAPGVREATTNSATGRTYVSWHRSQTHLGEVCRVIARLGYRPQPLKAGGADPQVDERRDALKRLAVAGLGMMQVMMFAVATYSADLTGEVIDAPLLQLFRLVSLLVTTPVMFYAAAPVFAAARRNLQTRTMGMDVPVTLALLLAYSASVWNTLDRNGGSVYYDSVTMFIFFLTLARFVQMSVRQRTVESAEALARQLPSHAHRLDDTGVSDVPLSALEPGDSVIVRLGEVLPADGLLLETDARIDEALLSGESLHVRKQAGDTLAAGTLNLGGPIRLRVTAVAGATRLSHIAALQQRAQAQRPAAARAADAAAANFLRYVLIGAGLTCAFWLNADPSRAFEATLAVLVVACPCAFAIATPAAISAVSAHLARRGLLITRIDAIEMLARVDRFVFDKTGTLTRGDLAVRSCVPRAELGPERCMQIAAALERASEHPLARAFAHVSTPLQATQVRAVPSCGLEGSIDGYPYAIGTPQFVGRLRGEDSPPAVAGDTSGTVVVLGDARAELAAFELQDTPRTSAVTAIAALQGMHIESQILSGDSLPAVEALAASCGVGEYFARRSPEQKLIHVRTSQERGHRVAMVGDGVNDAPVLAAADLSIAMGGGTALAHASADMLLVTEDLDCLPDAVRLARKAQRIARQNMIWAGLYNFGSLPLAAAGLISPWLAALGMSLSSIAVVLNASRLLPPRRSRA